MNLLMCLNVVTHLGDDIPYLPTRRPVRRGVSPPAFSLLAFLLHARSCLSHAKRNSEWTYSFPLLFFPLSLMNTPRRVSETLRARLVLRPRPKELTVAARPSARSEQSPQTGQLAF